MWSRKPLIVTMALLVAILALLTSKMNSDKSEGDHPRQRARPDVQSKVPANTGAQKREFPKLKPVNAKMVTTPSGLKYQDIVVGTGPTPRKGDTLAVIYTGWKPDGQPFDSNDAPGEEPLEFRVGRGKVIKGWDEGVVTMKVGGKRRLIIPPDLAYGEAGYVPTIEPNLTLIFDVKLLAIRGKS